MSPYRPVDGFPCEATGCSAWFPTSVELFDHIREYHGVMADA